MPSSSRNARSVRTMSATVMTGKSDPYGFPVAGFDRRRPGRPAAAAEQVGADDEEAIGVERLAGPIMPSHQPRPLAAVPSRSSAAKPSRVLSAAASSRSPAACASPLNAWQTRMTLSRAGESVAVGLVGDADRCSSRPQSSRSGSERSRNCVSTVPTEPAAASAPSWPCAR